ncbi:predicted protein [Sclerotinia sclerotiorum 1980 UF-70]|uniref:Uncharacterized protein n=1 Tax=Sclerotinia sclerotiorum (strain ATCC 18683 / 1980 / Ss-1) TaxID=665079 RepID=A7EWH5_SCLS1|nr:predicted protein [Sclerotinia sclerotiorum 1980 UF-70]EDN93817.1 predicted protein [Sclerotinia sclerotiorum 1980 UF-70]
MDNLQAMQYVNSEEPEQQTGLPKTVKTSTHRL